MGEHADKIKAWIDDRDVDAEFLSFESSVHSVEAAIASSGYPIEQFTKSIVVVTDAGQAVIAIVPADARASTERIRKALGLAERPRLATADESEKLLGQQLGGNCPLNARDATVIVDPQVAAREWILTGGGDDRSLVRISLAELRRVTPFSEARVRK